VAGFAGSTLHADPNFAIEDDATADAGAEGVHEERVDGVGVAGAEEEFSKGGEAGVVTDLDGMIEASLELEAKVDSVKSGKVGQMAENPEGKLDGARAADADAEEFAGLFLDELADGAGHIVEDSVRPGGEARGEIDLFEDFAGWSDGRDAEVGASEVDTDGERMHDDSRVHDTRRARLEIWRGRGRGGGCGLKSHMMDRAMTGAFS
jgi:hypothetical protein